MRRLIINSHKVQVRFKPTHLEVTQHGSTEIIGYRYIYEIYLHPHVCFSMVDLLRYVSMPVYFIDGHGYIKAKLTQSPTA